MNVECAGEFAVRCGGFVEGKVVLDEVGFEKCGIEFEGVVDDDDEEGAVWSLTAWA